jgi:hypothetical protein
MIKFVLCVCKDHEHQLNSTCASTICNSFLYLEHTQGNSEQILAFAYRFQLNQTSFEL